jgi:S-adenosylmethionine hydrolase
MPVVTLSTDIGQSDYVVGAMKGQLVQALPSVSIIDITHQLVANNYLHAAYVCANAFAFYPAGTFHFVIINLFEKPPQHLLLAKLKDQFIVCPDNGILTMIAGEKPENIVTIKIVRHSVSGVLNCTEAFANALTAISNGAAWQSIGNSISDIEEKYPFRSTVDLIG